MALNDVVKKAVLEDIGRCDAVHLGHNPMDNYFRIYHQTIKFLYDNKLLNDADIDSILEKKVIDEAKVYLKMMNTKLNGYLYKGAALGGKIKNHTYADHVLRPEFLAYALEKNALSVSEIHSINFDHGDTSDSYVKYYGKTNLIENLRKELLNPKPEPTFGEYDEHPTCSMLH